MFLIPVIPGVPVYICSGVLLPAALMGPDWKDELAADEAMIESLVRDGDLGENVLVDQFERRGLVRAAVAEFGVRLTEVPRAERHAVVAAASIIARREFLLGLKELSEDFGVALHKGAGAPVDSVGVDLVREQGEDALHGAAKLHFKNTEKILSRV